MARLGAALATLTCFAAGLYLLSSQAAASNSYLELLAHGIGLYFIGKGLFIASSMSQQFRAADALDKLVEWRAFDHAMKENASGGDGEEPASESPPLLHS